MSAKAHNMAARMAAVQAQYQMWQNRQRVRDMLPDFIEQHQALEIDGDKLVAPDADLLRRVLEGAEERSAELQALVNAQIARETSQRELDLILKSILICACYELLAHQEIDPPVIINDYLNITHSFYEKNQAGFINGVLDSLSKILR